MTYTVENGVILSEGGFPYGRRWFADGRLALESDGGTVTQIDYHASEGTSYRVFSQGFWDGIRCYLRQGHHRTGLKPRKARILPYGYFCKDGETEFGVFLADGRIFFLFRPEKDTDVDLEFYDDGLFHPETHAHGRIDRRGGERTWLPFRMEEGELRGGYREGEGEIPLRFSSNRPLSYRKSARNGKNILTLSALTGGEEAVLCLGLGTHAGGFSGVGEALSRQEARYAAVAERAPRLTSPHPLVDRFFALAPLYQESLKVPELPGAIRAQSTHYWVWGWDSLTSADTYLYLGDMEFAERMLALFEDHAHPEGGIPHAFGPDMSAAELAPPSAQGMYLTLLDLVRLGGGSWREHYAFAKRIARSILRTEVEETGLCLGYSLFPDYRDLIGETGRDLSAFNNTVTYCALRSMERLAEEAGDGEFREELSAFTDRTRAHFDRLFYNSSLGFVDSSLDAETKAGRGILSVNSVKWENNFCADLLAGREAEYLRTFEEKLLSPAGLRPMAEDCPCYDGDANQLHCWWPVMSECYARLIHRGGREDLIRGYLGFAEYWSERLCCPEGIPTYDNDPLVPFDRWNAAPGIWHGYSVRGFYNAILHAYVGVDVDGEGLHLAPVTEDAVSLGGLRFGKYTFDIEIEAGRGGEVILDGRSLGNITCIPFSLLGEHNTVLLSRG